MKAIHLATACLLFATFSCGRSNKEYSGEENAKATSADSISSNGFISSSAAVQNKNRQIIRKL